MRDEFTSLEKLKEAYNRLKIAKELYDKIIDGPAEDDGQKLKKQTKLRFAREQIMKSTLKAKKLLKDMERMYDGR